MNDTYNNAAISITEHDSSITILKDGKVYEILLEERLSGKKKDNFLFFCYEKLSKFNEEYGLNLISIINGTAEDFVQAEKFLKKYNLDNIEKEYCFDKHHLYHAASAFYGSGFDDAICLVIDGWGASWDVEKLMQDSNLEFVSNDALTFLETTSVYEASYPNNFNPLYKRMVSVTPNHVCIQPISYEILTELNRSTNADTMYDINSSYDMGLLYGTVTDHLGMDREDCGKTMGLSAYGRKDSDIPSFILKDTLYADMNLFHNNRYINTVTNPNLVHDDDFQKKADIAYRIQETMEYVLVKRIEQILDNQPSDQSSIKNIVFSGGCALNICANSAIQKRFPEINFFIDPIADDSCQSYGAAKLAYYMKKESFEKEPLTTTYHGARNYKKEIMKNLIEMEVLKANLQEKQN